ncbi:MAG: histidine kinase [Gammaproteobacteria bacterium]
MSLRLRLNLLITLLFIFLFIISSFYILANARNSVEREVESTAQLALQLIQLAITSADIEKDSDKKFRFLDRLAQLEETRHLHIEINNADQVFTPAQATSVTEESNAPNWFVRLVQPPPTELRRWLYNPVIPPTGIMVSADPTDEIEEAWTEVKSLLILLFLFITLANLLVYFVIGRYLAPLATIAEAVTDIEKGNYQQELPRFDLPELNILAQRFNHMTGVLRKSREENRQLTQRSLKIQEDERRHLAQELHDELGQTITAIKAVAVAINNDKNPEPDRIQDNVHTILNYSDHMYGVARNMMHRLRPSVLDEFGLVKALQNMIDDWNSRQDDVFCHFEFSEGPVTLDETIRISLYRIIQESLTNVLKHASATEITIKLQYHESGKDMTFRLDISDDGVGIDLDNLRPGLGLLGMRERVEMLHGSFQLDTEINKGLRIQIEIPLDTTE